ncbi:MAG: hypothetical protein B7X41_18660, partial [Microbacterium sp. 14-71-5]
MGAVTPLTLVAPHSGAESGAESVQERTAPPALREPVGPLIGSNAGAPAFLSADDMWSGVMALGEAGSGKSELLGALWGYDAAARTGLLPTSPSLRNGHGMIAFDTKNDSKATASYTAWSQAAGDNIIRIDVSDVNNPYGIELFPTTGPAVGRARRVVNALKYVFGDGIGSESFDTLTRVFTAAFAVTPDVISEVRGLEAGRSPFHYANILLTSRGDDLGKQVADVLRMKADRTGDADAREATEGLSPLYDPQRTAAQRQALVKAPRNKMEQLSAAEHWWSRPKRASWASLLNRHASVVVNFGSVDGEMLDEELSAQLAGIMMYTLRDEIQRNCVGWWDDGRGTSIYADELKHLAGMNPTVISWFRNDARAYGVRPKFATQFPEQLDKEVRTTVMGFGTLVTFAQKDSGVVDSIVRALSTGGA